MDLWLSPHDARIRTLRDGGTLGYGSFDSPFGPCHGLSHGAHLLALRFEEVGKVADQNGVLEELQKEWPDSRLVESQETHDLLLRAFLAPAEVPVMAIGTPFRLAVWEFLRRSGTAVTMTYGEVARAIGRPSAARAVGQAAGANPLAIVIPCHRVVSRGKLTGYRWGLDRKKALLAWELSRRDPLEMPF